MGTDSALPPRGGDRADRCADVRSAESAFLSSSSSPFPTARVFRFFINGYADSLVTQRRQTSATASFSRQHHLLILNIVSFTTLSVSQPCHCLHNVLASTTSFPRTGGDPGKETVQGETVSGNGKQPGRKDRQSRTIPGGETFPARSALRLDSRLRGNDVRMPNDVVASSILCVKSTGGTLLMGKAGTVGFVF